ncbi:carboxymuconolactone decarboxylase family protein [Streptomyces spiralis]
MYANPLVDPMPEPQPRLKIAQLASDVFRKMIHLEAAVRNGIEQGILHLVQIRASQINHCAICLDMYTKDALAAGESVERIVQLAAWRESQHFYTPREIAAINIAEAVTILPDGCVPAEAYVHAREHFGETELAHLLSAIVTVNIWNRLGVTSRAVPGYYAPNAAGY